MAQISQERVEVLRQAGNTSQQARVTSEYVEYIAAPSNTQEARVTNIYIEIMFKPKVNGAVFNPWVMG